MKKNTISTRLPRHAASCTPRNDGLFVLAAFIALILASPVNAADITVICEAEGECRSESDGAVFDVSDAAPGSDYERSIEVINERTQECSVSFSLDEVEGEDEFMRKVQTVIADGDRNYFDGSFLELADEESVDLGEIDGNDANLYKWTMGLDEDTGNDYQDKEVRFDVDISMTCDEEDGETAAGGSVAGALAAAKTPRVLGDMAKSVLTRFPTAGKPLSGKAAAVIAFLPAIAAAALCRVYLSRKA